MDNRVSPIGGEGMRRTDQNSSSSRRVVSPRSKSRFTRPESSGEEVGPSTSRHESRGGGVEFESFLGSGRDGGENPQIQPLDRENPVYEDPNGVSGSRRIQGSKRGESGLYSLSQRGGFIEFASSLNRSAFSVQRQNSRGEVDMLTSSQREMSEDSSRLVYINDPLETNSKHEFSGNSIRTSKYSIITFIPRNLYEQFHRIAYIYFLVITIMNNLPQLAVFGRAASALPLVFVLVVTAMKDAYEDFRRHRSDKIENNRVAHILEKDHYMPRRWRDIRVGEIIRITANETIPCDMVLLSTSDPTGVAYIQTINLDGESNLKTRYAKQETMALLSDMEGIRGMIRCELPNRNIYGFQATMDLDDRPISLGPTNIILRGCELKNTAWAVGVVVYAGPETKAMLNSSGAPSKRSRLETHMNRETIMLSIFLIALCSMVTTLSGIWMVRNASQLDIIPYFRKADYSGPTPVDSNWYGIPMQTFFIFLMAIIVFQTMIPISLYISMELVRLGQAYFMSRDHRLYDESSNSRFQCRALNINEDLGMIKYVFSDKTGTLTENKMEFQCASIRGKDYNAVALGIEVGRPSVEVSGQVLKPKMEVKVNPDLLQLLRNHEDGEDDTEERRRAEEFFLALATCNTIVPLITETSERGQSLLDYQGESPDEQALVYSAAAHGYALIERTSGYLNVDVQGLKQKFNVLGMHEFDSDRKRMSVIVRCPDGTVKLFVKGADSSMFEVINEPDDSDVLRATKAHLQGYSNVGLRTLVIAVRDLTPEEFNEWQAEYAKASTALIGRASLLKSLATATERDLFLLGATAIEDKLQEGVPEAIESLRLAGIKVWVLTGDKQETAISIGFSCRLLTTEMRQIIINSRSRDSCRRLLEQATKDISQGPAALIIDGTSLVYVLETDLEDTLFELATNCTVVLCCRVAPMQKAGIVALIKERTEDMSLAIGDGANDVSMIQMADIGIGISGQEGRQAVMASDFSMGQFRFLVPLLLVHGHWNYQRIAYMVLYNFYRNAVFVLVLFWYTLYTAYTLTTAITEWSSVAYSVIYTSVPTVVVGILDKDLSHKTLLRYPSLYGIGQREESYNIMWFWVTMFDTLWQSVAIFYIPYCVYQVSAMDMSSLGDLWTLCVVIVVNLHLAMDVLRWSWITHVAIWGSIIASFISVIIIDSFKDLSGFGAIFTAATYPSFWLNLLIVPIAALLPRFIVKIFNQQFLPSDIQISREQEYLKRMRPASATVESRSNGYANGNR